VNLAVIGSDVDGMTQRMIWHGHASSEFFTLAC
jgi:hypothetical protein